MAPPSDLLRDSFALAAAREPALVERFYDRLFERAPELASMFRRRRAEQAAMLQAALAAVLDHLDDAAWLSSTLGALGARHAGYGVTAPMYAVVADVLVDALAAVCAERWSDAHERAWRDALGTVATLMLAGVAVAA